MKGDFVTGKQVVRIYDNAISERTAQRYIRVVKDALARNKITLKQYCSFWDIDYHTAHTKIINAKP